ncbi:ig-like domain-containing protein [Trichonephila inaurata madagascariensis]|uniref:Ig-like domain-containing protein n=1 Tax=Trichonephila inaurata madagascariensis TaxID=2747483 RepID=A0A8X6XQ28_9ARAC|nr:ig-like domain-containing protein [Trichonephila inaurata madagascariensis]
MPEKLIMNESQSADLICSASGDPPITLYWNTFSLVSNHTVGDFELLGLISSDYENGSLERFNNFSFDANSSTLILSISASHGTDNGFVSCIAENDVGQEIAEVSLEINAVPNIEEMRVAKNFYWCIYYKVTGFPKPQRTWYFNNILLQNPLIQDLENAWTMKNSYLADALHLYSGGNILIMTNYRSISSMYVQ